MANVAFEHVGKSLYGMQEALKRHTQETVRALEAKMEQRLEALAQRTEERTSRVEGALTTALDSVSCSLQTLQQRLEDLETSCASCPCLHQGAAPVGPGDRASHTVGNLPASSSAPTVPSSTSNSLPDGSVTSSTPKALNPRPRSRAFPFSLKSSYNSSSHPSSKPETLHEPLARTEASPNVRRQSKASVSWSDISLSHAPSSSSPAGTALGEELCEAAREGRARDVQRLLDRGANVNHRDALGVSPLLCAALCGHWDLAKLLLDRGATLPAEDSYARKALLAACRNDLSGDFVSRFVDSAADGAGVLAVGDEIGRTPLHEAALHGNAAAVRVLLAAGADVRFPDPWGASPLHLAARSGNQAVLGALIAAGADVSAVDVDGQTPLHWAAWNSHHSVLRVLASVGGDVNAQDKRGRTPLHWAASEGSEAAVRTLLDAGANKGVVDDDGNVAVDLAREDLRGILQHFPTLNDSINCHNVRKRHAK